ncbi:MAG: hypothetical protein MUC88_00280 [Planctomycetes bacterium]|jgi:hypothetical protein|nr:hypothetical protein [Planctomycetota bacterium]
MSREWGQTVTTIPTPMVEGQSVAYDWMDLVRRVSDLEEENRSLRRQVYVGEHEFPDLTWKARCEELIGERLKLQDLVSELRENIRRLLDVVGDRLPCKGPTCTATIWFVRTKRGKITPYDGDACNHFATCPDAAKFKRKGDDK